MKGQLFSMDFLMALTIFFVVIVMAAYLWLAMPSYRIYDVQERANSIAEFLVTSKVGEENILECSKITALASKDDKTIKTELNANPYGIWVEFKNTTTMCNGDKVDMSSESTSPRIASVVRIVYVEGEKIQMVVRLYD